MNNKYARVVSGTVIEVVNLPLKITPAEAFHASIANEFHSCPDEVMPNCLYDGAIFSEPALLPEVDFAELQMLLKRSVDNAAENERLKYITPGNGQAMTYQQKVTEAQAFKAATNPQQVDYPMLTSEVGITAETLDDVADVVLAAFTQWQHIGAAIEAIRLGAKRDIDLADDEATARAVVDAIEWPQPAL
ncbi:hypothetical protein F9K97_03205 [Brucella anthropi]|uniref:hypothetical protein n=1 Tax=Brucella anthropi TaxID=529 RepID=UPI00124CC2D3|nr:hypothetical protein [Brucella anthropi]KAB2788127.1 hypothetical protein F9K97_03205 [Brucella anthropi]